MRDDVDGGYRVTHKELSSTLAVIPYAEFMFSYATRKKLTTPFLDQKWVF